MKVPEGDGTDLGGLSEVDLDPVGAAREFDFETFFATLVAVGEVGEVSGRSFAGAGGDVATLGEIDGGGGYLGQLARHGGDRLEVVDLHRARRAESDGLRQDERELLIFSEKAEREDEEAESEVLHGKGWS